MKFLLVLVVLVVAVLWMVARPSRRKVPPGVQPPAAPPKVQPGAAAMLACAHCGVHLPSQEALFDGSGKPFCGAEHRLAGPV